MNNTSRDTEHGDIPWFVSFKLPELVIWITLNSCVSIVAIGGNLLVIAAFVRAINLNSRLNYFVVGLAVADILVGSVSIPMWNYILFLSWKRLAISTIISRCYEAFDVFASVNSILHLMAISMERLYATLKPHSWNSIISKKLIYQSTLLLIWSSSSILAILFAIPWNINKTISATRFHLMNIFFFGPLVLICIAYAGIWYGIKKRANRRNPRKSAERQSIRLTFTVLIVIGLFIVAWLPFFTVRFILDDCRTYCVPWRLFYFSKVLHFSNSGINPVVYGLRIPEYRKFLTRVLHVRPINFLVNYYAMFEGTNAAETMRRHCSRFAGDASPDAENLTNSRPNSKVIKTSAV